MCMHTVSVVECKALCTDQLSLNLNGREFVVVGGVVVVGVGAYPPIAMF